MQRRIYNWGVEWDARRPEVMNRLKLRSAGLVALGVLAITAHQLDESATITPESVETQLKTE